MDALRDALGWLGSRTASPCLLDRDSGEQVKEVVSVAAPAAAERAAVAAARERAPPDSLPRFLVPRESARGARSRARGARRA